MANPLRCFQGRRCKIAAKGTSDWHDLILGGRTLDCESRHGLAFRPALDYHCLDTLGVKLPRCEDHSRTRKGRAYAFSSSLSPVEGSDCFEPGAKGVDCKMVPCVRLFFLLKVRWRLSQACGTQELLKGPFSLQHLMRT